MFNEKGHIWRSLKSMTSFCDMDEDQLLELMNAEMSDMIVLKPSTKGKGILVALKSNIVVNDGPVQIMGGNAIAPGFEAEISEEPAGDEENVLPLGPVDPEAVEVVDVVVEAPPEEVAAPLPPHI